jgi:ankyrin repeat protein
VVKLLLQERVKTSPPSTYGQSGLVSAAMNGQEKMVSLLLENRVRATPDALQKATENMHLAVVKVLLDWGAHNGGYRGEEDIALLWAAGSGHAMIVELLLDGGANKEARDRNGMTALNRAAYGAQYVYWNKPLEYSNARAYHNGHEEVVRLLLDRGVNTEAKGWFGMTALHHAADGENNLARHSVPGVYESIARLLLDHGADIEAKDIYGRTAIHCAASNGSKSVSMLLLRQGADLEARDRNERTALHYAADRWHHHWSGRIGSRSMLQLLLDQGADEEAKDVDSRTAMSCAPIPSTYEYEYNYNEFGGMG